MKKIIGITCNFSLDDRPGIMTKFGFAKQQWHMIADEYIRTVENTGVIPVLIPIYRDAATLAQSLDRFDGFIISGGNDINPSFYQEAVSAETGTLVTIRDEFETELTRAVLERTDKPLLAICRGIQLLNVVLGGNLYQDLEKSGFKNHYCNKSPINRCVHEVFIEDNSLLKSIIGCSTLGVNSYHHQAVKQLAPSLRQTAVSEDGVIEAAELPGQRFVLGVQWHPEMLYDDKVQQRIMRAFAASC